MIDGYAIQTVTCELHVLGDTEERLSTEASYAASFSGLNEPPGQTGGITNKTSHLANSNF